MHKLHHEKNKFNLNSKKTNPPNRYAFKVIISHGLHLFGPQFLYPSLFFVFQYLDGAKVVNIPKKILTLLTTLFQITFKIASNRHKCGNNLPKETIFFVAFRPQKKGIYNKILHFEKQLSYFGNVSSKKND